MLMTATTTYDNFARDFGERAGLQAAIDGRLSAELSVQGVGAGISGLRDCQSPPTEER